MNVTEVATCQYVMKFSTPVVCHETAMTVYARLTKEYQRKWDQLLTDYKEDYLTEKVG